MRSEKAAEFDPFKLARENIVRLKPYSSARDEFSGSARIFLDANENPLGSPTSEAFNRYPDPYQRTLKDQIGRLEGVDAERIFLGNGSDEAIDLLFRVFCEPRTANCIICPPTYGMYEVAAGINDVEVRRVPLSEDLELDADGVIGSADENTRLVFICSPNNPTGNAMDLDSVARVAESMNGLVVVDEAYIHFSTGTSAADLVEPFPNIVVLRTFSKAWGLAGLRVGIAIADPRVISLLNKVKPPYNLSDAAMNRLLEAIGNEQRVRSMVEEITGLRDELARSLADLPVVERVFPSDANFLLARFPDPSAVYSFLLERGIVVRDRSRLERCEDCLRISVGTRSENEKLIDALDEFGRPMK